MKFSGLFGTFLYYFILLSASSSIGQLIGGSLTIKRAILNVILALVLSLIIIAIKFAIRKK